MFELLNQQIKAGQREFTGEFFQKLVASDGAADDVFGYSVSISGDGTVIVIGSNYDDDRGNDSGSAYIFTKQPNGSYLQTQKLTASDGAANDQFGTSVSVSADGSVVVVGAYRDDDKGTDSGSVYIFTRQANGSYLRTQKLTASDGAANDSFGRSVSASSAGAVVVIGAYGDGDRGTRSGSVYIFTRQADGSYLQTQKLTATDGASGDWFGYSVSVSSDGAVIVVGAQYDDDKGTDSGSVYIFTRQANGSYLQTQKLLASDGTANDYFGRLASVTGDGSVVAVGAHGDSDKGTSSGSVYIFTKQANGSYIQTQKITAPDGASGDWFGYSVSITPDASMIAIGAHGDDDKGAESGSVYIFTRQIDAMYALSKKLALPNNSPSSNMGFSLVVSSEKTVVAGAYYETVNGVVRAGSVYIFK